MRVTSKGRRRLSVSDQDHFETDDSGDLYWKGRKIRTGGWTAAVRISFAAVMIPFLALLANLAINYDKLGGLWYSIRDLASGSAPVSPVQEQNSIEKSR